MPQRSPTLSSKLLTVCSSQEVVRQGRTRFENPIFTWWARSLRIRTAAELPFEIPLFQTAESPVYRRIADRALQLRQLGLTPAVIARYLGVSDKTATKAIAWIKGESR